MNMGVEMNNIVWFQGNLQNINEANINVLSPTVQYGLNVFEGIRCYLSLDKKSLNAFRLDDHIDRLYNSCKILKLRLAYSKSELVSAISKTISANQFQNDISMRVVVLVDKMGNWAYQDNCELLISPMEMQSNLMDESGMTACISSWERISDRSMSPRIKCGANYMNSRMAQLEALENGYDMAIMLNRHGYVSEAPGSCLFMIKDGCLITPRSTDSILESITRDTVIRLASDQLGIKVIERAIDRTELYLADEVFLCGTAMEIRSLFSVDKMEIGNGTVGAITSSIKDFYYKAIRGNENSSGYGWLNSMSSCEALET